MSENNDRKLENIDVASLFEGFLMLIFISAVILIAANSGHSQEIRSNDHEPGRISSDQRASQRDFAEIIDADKKASPITAVANSGEKTIKDEPLAGISSSAYSDYESDYKVWPLQNSPYYWLLKEYVDGQNWSAARKTIAEALARPQPRHFELIFAYFHLQLGFYNWLGMPETERNDKTAKDLAALFVEKPEIWKERNFTSGYGFIDKGKIDTENISLMTGAVQQRIWAAVQSKTGIFKHIAQWKSRVAKSCAIKRTLVNQTLPQPHINERYAAVDYIYHSIEMSHRGADAALPGEVSLQEAVEKYWTSGLLPVCSGHVMTFTRNRWHCQVHPQETDTEALTVAQLNEAWQEFILCNPEYKEALNLILSEPAR